MQQDNQQPRQLAGKAALVSGASRNIGRAIALKLAKNGAHVVVHGTQQTLLQDLATEIRSFGVQAAWTAGDAADQATAETAVAVALAEFGTLDILVNNAGIITRSSTLDMPLTDWQRVLDVNLNGTLHFCRAALPTMISAGTGSIVNISSTTARSAHKNAAPAYGASKAAIEYLTRHLALEMAGKGVRVNAVSPGPVSSDMSLQWSADYRQQVLDRIPLGRLGNPEEIADIVLFLASDMSTFVTGTTIDANGGSQLR